jgi:SAM-dependent methyltransferase
MDRAVPGARCKICDSSDVSVIQELPVESLISAWKKTLGLEIASLFENIERIEVNECSTCHLIFFMPDVYPSTDRIYSELERFDWYYMPRKWEYRMALMDIKDPGKILEIGCGAGHFLKEAHEKRGAVAVGIELNEGAVTQTQRQGLETYCMDIEEAASLWPNQFDAVCIFQVLEHVKNPKDFLLKAIELLRPGGKLMLGTPNADSFLKNQFNVLDMPPHHLTRWNSRVMVHLPNSFPLSLQRIKEEPLAPYHVRDYLESHCAMIKEPSYIRKLCSPRLRNIFVRFLIHSRIHRLLKGHTLYTCFARN